MGSVLNPILVPVIKAGLVNNVVMVRSYTNVYEKYLCIVTLNYVSVSILAICFPPDGCRNGGHCAQPGICSCTTGWRGPACADGNDEC